MNDFNIACWIVTFNKKNDQWCTTLDEDQCYHNSWPRKSPITWLFVQQHFLTNNKENIKAPYHWTNVVGIHPWPVACTHKGSVMRKAFPCHGGKWYHGIVSSWYPMCSPCLCDPLPRYRMDGLLTHWGLLQSGRYRWRYAYAITARVDCHTVLAWALGLPVGYETRPPTD